MSQKTVSNVFLALFVLVWGAQTCWVTEAKGQPGVDPTDFWTSNFSSFYDLGSNWEDGSAPTGSLHAVFDVAADYLVQWDDITGNTSSRSVFIERGDVEFRRLNSADAFHQVLTDMVVQPGATLGIASHDINVLMELNVAGGLEVFGGTVLDVFGGLRTLQNSGDDATIDILGAGTEINVSSNATIGGAAQTGGGDGTLRVADGAAFNLNGNISFGTGLGLTGIGRFQGAGTTFDINPTFPLDGIILVGGDGLGDVIVSEGAVGEAGELRISKNGSISIIGDGSSLTVNSETNIGGPLAITDSALNLIGGGRLISEGTASIIGEGTASDSTHRGVVRVFDGGRWTMDGLLEVGRFAEGSLSVFNGGFVQSLDGISVFGNEAGSSGVVSVSGEASTLAVDSLDAGLEGDCQITIADGGYLESLDCFLGLGPGAGDLRVSGAGSDLFTGTFRFSSFGDSGVGDFALVSNGGCVTCISLQVDGGELRITGEGSTFNQLGAGDCDLRGMSLVAIDDGAEFICESIGQIDVDAVLEMNGVGPRIEAAGGVNISGGTLAVSGSQAEINGNVENFGTIQKLNSGGLSIFGDLFVDDSGDLEIAAGGSIAVHGDFDATVVSGPGSMFLVNTFSPNGDDVGETVFEGNLQLRPSSTTNIQIGGTDMGDYDRFIVENTMQLQGGNLNVEFVDGFTPSVFDEFVIADGPLSGQFNGLDNGDVVATSGSIALRIIYNASQVVLIADELSVLLGDVNLDGEVNLLDVTPFINVIATGQFQAEADINQDGVVNLLDAGPFVELLTD